MSVSELLTDAEPAPQLQIEFGESRLSCMKLENIIWGCVGLVLGLIIPTPFPCVRFWLIASAWSFFLAYYAFEIHVPPVTRKVITKVDEGRAREEQEIVQSLDYANLPHTSMKIHQFIFNFSGAMVGWVIIFLYKVNYLSSISSGLEKILLGSIVFISLTGYLPYIITKFGAFGK